MEAGRRSEEFGATRSECPLLSTPSHDSPIKPCSRLWSSAHISPFKSMVGIRTNIMRRTSFRSVSWRLCISGRFSNFFSRLVKSFTNRDHAITLGWFMNEGYIS
jgi:hypothetical protein